MTTTFSAAGPGAGTGPDAAVQAAQGAVQNGAWLLIALPLLGAAVLLLSGRRGNAWGHLLGCATVLGAFAYGVALFASVAGDASPVRELHLFSWIPVGALQVDFGLRLDPLSMVFVLLITGVGALIHLYSVGYMAHDQQGRTGRENTERRRFFGYLNLFVGAMLILVLGNSFVTLYLGWEGVGLASYLLIGFWQHRPSAAAAATKAFVMNRVGDVGLALAIFLLFAHLGTTQYTEVFARAGELPSGVLLAITLLLLLGACGKSGQVPLQAWLPDAMEGPTPVSALIHAATMVTAGVYLIARANPIYTLSPDGRLVVTVVGAVTLLVGCVIGCAYDDIKKVLAYSTVSQIGYMVLAVGLGPAGYALGIMHLLTHGFFKAGLFLGAGSVMHGMNDEVDMRKFGGLARYMPVTFATFGFGYLALIGFPFLSGYFSKDAIIEAAFGQEGARGWIFGGAAVLGAALTAFYMTRLMLMTFFGEKRWEGATSADGREFHPHESPAIMTGPMVLLALGSLGAGAFLSLTAGARGVLLLTLVLFMLSRSAGLFFSGAAFSLFAGGFFSSLLLAFFSGAGSLFSLAGSLFSCLTLGAGFVLSIAGRKFLLDLSVTGSFGSRILHENTAAAHFHLNGAGAARGVSLLDHGLFLAGNRNSAGLFRRLAAFLIRAL